MLYMSYVPWELPTRGLCRNWGADHRVIQCDVGIEVALGVKGMCDSELLRVRDWDNPVVCHGVLVSESRRLSRLDNRID